MSPRRRRALVLAPLALVLLAGCSGTSGGEQGPVQVSSGEPVPGNAPGLGSASLGPVSVSGLALHGAPGDAVTVSGQVTSTSPDRLVSVATNYTRSASVSPPLAIAPGAPVALQPSTVQLVKTGTPGQSLDDGATVAVTLTFATAGAVQVFATYRS